MKVTNGKRLLCIILIGFIMSSLMSIFVMATPTNTSFSTAIQLSSDLGDQKTITGVTTGVSLYYYLNVTSGQHISTAIYDSSNSANFDLRLYNSSQSQVASSTRSGTATDAIAYTSTYTGKYYIRITATSVPSSSASCKFKAIKACGISGTSSTNSSYNRTNAKTYMQSYTVNANPSYNDYTGDGGDCTNFVSQVVKAGGMANANGSISANTSWYAYSETWKSATKFTNHWGTNSVGSGNKRAYSCQYFHAQGALNNYQSFIQNIKVGDVIQICAKTDSARFHSLVVYEAITGDLKMSQHTSNQFVNLSIVLNNYNKYFITVIRIKQGS